MKKALLTVALLIASATAAPASEIGHYAGGLLNIRDFFIPEPGFYGTVYNYYYHTDRLNDRHGDEVRSVTIGSGTGPGLTLGIDPDVDVYVLAPALVWVTPYEILGARYAALIVPTFANSSVGASLSTQSGRGADPSASQFGIGDLYVQPLSLGWPLEHWDLTLAWGFYAPTGKYDVDTVTFPIIGPRKVESADNIGLGFWTNQFQSAVAWYPWTNKGTALTAALTYEINSDKERFDVTPGDNLTLNWGISQYLPLTADMKWLTEVGPAGYSTWQVSADSGSDASNSVKDQVHGVGWQVGLTSVGWATALNLHYFYEVASEDRFEGHVLGLSIAKKF
ncbi:MAG: transporter [Deltaproteobacteria bacterium]|nr:transporter [Deltaproteobacteria bacterium]